MKDINDYIHRPKDMLWGSLTNYKPTKPQYRAMADILPHDNRWHTIISGEGSVTIDGKEIRRRTAESLT